MALDFQPVDFQPASAGIDFQPIDFQPAGPSATASQEPPPIVEHEQYAPPKPHVYNKPANPNDQSYSDYLGKVGRSVNAVGEAVANSAAAGIGGVVGLVGGPLSYARQRILPMEGEKPEGLEDTITRITRGFSEPLYEESSPLGQHYTDMVNEAFNQIGIPMAGLHLGTPGEMRKSGKTKLPVNERVEPTVGSKLDKLSQAPVDFQPVKAESPVQGELPLGWNEQQMAESKQLDTHPGQADLFGPQNVPKADLGLSPDVPGPTSVERTQPYMDERNQGLIDDTPHNGNAELPFTGNVSGVVPRDAFTRIDENGMPVRADRSMEAQNLQDPLQRNLWGDELPRQSEQEAKRGITAAMDRMDPAARAEAIRTQLTHSDEGYIPQSQRGAIDLLEIGRGLAALRRGEIGQHGYLDKFKGAFDPQEFDFAKRNLNNPKSRETIVMMKPSDFHELAAGRQGFEKGQHAEDLRVNIRSGLKSEKGLREMPALWIETGTDGIAKVKGHEGRHRMDVFKEQGVGLVPVKVTDSMLRWGETPVENWPKQLRPENMDRDAFNKPMPKPLTTSTAVLKPKENTFALEKQHEATFNEYLKALESGDTANAEVLRKQADSLIDRIYVPASQRGAIDLGPTPVDPAITKINKNDPAVQAARDELLTNKKKAIANKIIGNAYVDDITTPEQVIAAVADGAKDIGAGAVARMKSIGSGINSAVLSSNNPLLKLGRYLYRTAEKTADRYAERYVTSEDTGIAHKWHKLSKEERNEVAEVWHKQDKEQTWFDEERLRNAGYSDKQIDVINQQREMEQVKLRVWNEELAKQGKPPVDERPGHFPGVFAGDYRTLVLEKKGDTWTPVGFIGANTRYTHAKLVEDMKKKNPERRYEELPRRKLGNLSSSAHDYGLNELAKVLAEHDPAFADLLHQADSLTATRANELYGAGNHALAKKGIEGSQGNKPWLSRDENTKEMFQAYVSYWDQGMRSHLNMPVEVQLKSLMNNPELAEMHNAKDYMKKYMLHATGRSMSDFGGAIDTLIGGVAHHVAGQGPSRVRTGLGLSNKRIGQIMMSFGNLWHTAVQFLQVPVMAWPQYANMISQFKLDPITFATSQKAGVADTFAMKMGKAVDDPYKQASIDYAKEMGLNHFSEFQDLSEINQSTKSRVADHMIDLNRKIPEVTTRPMVFFTIMDMLKNEKNLTMEQKLSAAYNATQEAMIDYSPREKPMIYGDMGQVGKLSGSLSTFKHGAYAQYGRLIKGAAKGKVMPLVAAMGTMYALAGLRGMIGYDDADTLVKAITGMAGNRRSIRELVLDPNIRSEVVKSGVLGAGFDLDLSNRISVAGVTPESVGQAIGGPFGTFAGKAIGDAVAVAKDPTSKLDWKNLALDLTPNGLGMKGPLKEYLMGDETTGRLDDRKGLPGNERTASEKKKNLFGIRSLRQANLEESQYNDLRRQLDKRDRQKAIVEKTKKYISQNQLTPERANEFLQEFLKNDGTPDKWKNAFTKEEFNLNLNKQQRLEGIPKTNSLESIFQYQNYQRSRDKLNGNQ